MNLESKRALPIFLASVLLVMSCDMSTFAAPQQVPTPIPGAIKLMVIQTAAVAATETAALIPPTLTPTLTPFPSRTPVNTPTITPTFVFLLPTSTTTPAPTGVSNAFECQLMSQSPQDGTHFAPNKSFTVTWKLRNTGSGNWYQDAVHLDYVSGAQLTSATIINLPRGLDSGNFFNLGMNMTSPNVPGHYTTNWTLATTSQNFCSLSLEIKVP
ncbi:MAG: NBR1-Ig-like domain-containing protein [Anaerolineales bacterium]